MFAIAGLLRKQGESIVGSVPRRGSKVQCGLRLSPQNGIIATHMKKTDIAALAGAALFTAVALVGLVLGRDWKLLLVPLFLLPTIRFFAADSTTKEVVSGSAPASTVFTVREIMLALVATAGAFALSARFATGKCVWSAGAMTMPTAVTKPQGTFYARAAQNLRGDRLEQRMLNATQEIAKHTKKTAELLKDGVGGGTLTFQ